MYVYVPWVSEHSWRLEELSDAQIAANAGLGFSRRAASVLRCSVISSDLKKSFKKWVSVIAMRVNSNLPTPLCIL